MQRPSAWIHINGCWLISIYPSCGNYCHITIPHVRFPSHMYPLLLTSFEPERTFYYKIACAPSEDSRMRRLISLRCPLQDALDPWLPTECPALPYLVLPCPTLACPALWGLWSDCADVQTVLLLLLVHVQFGRKCCAPAHLQAAMIKQIMLYVAISTLKHSEIEQYYYVVVLVWDNS